MREIYYFLQWYWGKNVAKFKTITYKPAYWHFVLPVGVLSMGVSMQVEDIEISRTAAIIFVINLGLASIWYFIKLWFFWDWIDYQKEKQKSFDALKDRDL